MKFKIGDKFILTKSQRERLYMEGCDTLENVEFEIVGILSDGMIWFKDSNDLFKASWRIPQLDLINFILENYKLPKFPKIKNVTWVVK